MFLLNNVAQKPYKSAKDGVRHYTLFIKIKKKTESHYARRIMTDSLKFKKELMME